jgi:hypothetical protein
MTLLDDGGHTVCDTIFSNVHMLSRTHREAETWPIAFVNYCTLTRLRTHPDAAPQLIFSMWKRSTLALLIAVYKSCSTSPPTWRSAYYLRGRADR